MYTGLETRNPVVCKTSIFWPKHKNVVGLNWNFYKKARQSKSRTVLRYIKFGGDNQFQLLHTVGSIHPNKNRSPATKVNYAHMNRRVVGSPKGQRRGRFVSLPCDPPNHGVLFGASSDIRERLYWWLPRGRLHG